MEARRLRANEAHQFVANSSVAERELTASAHTFTSASSSPSFDVHKDTNLTAKVNECPTTKA